MDNPEQKSGDHVLLPLISRYLEIKGRQTIAKNIKNRQTPLDPKPFKQSLKNVCQKGLLTLLIFYYAFER